MNRTRNVLVFDTTLRDGEQMPGVAFSTETKVALARKLAELGVPVIEAGFPVNSAEEAEAVRRVAAETEAEVCGMARVVQKDIQAALDAGVAMVDLFCSTSDIQMKTSALATPEKIMTASREAVARVKDAGRRCMYTPMDATRTEPDFLVEVCHMAAEAGADWLNLTDTVGVGRPETIAAMVGRVKEAVDAPVSIHCHDDFGLATANTVAAVMAGADMVQVCLNGLGERAGNAALEEVVMALTCLHNLDLGLNTKKLYEASRLLERLSGISLPPNKPVVGANAFCHESGIHAAGITRDRRAFEPGLMTPEMVGHRRRLVVGKHAGKHGIAQALAEAGLRPSPAELEEIAKRVRSVGSSGKIVLSADLYAIAEAIMEKVPEENRTIVLDQITVTTGDKQEPTATLVARVRGETRVEAQTGVGPVDAAVRAVQRLLGGEPHVEIVEYHVDAITGGSDATVRVAVTVEDEAGHFASAQSAHVDMVMASVDSLMTAVNHLARMRQNIYEGKEPPPRHAHAV